MTADTLTADTLTMELRRALAQLARTPRLLVACDYDGTLAPIVPDPQRAVPLLESVTALRSLAALPATTTAVISGRALRDLAVLSRLPAEVHLVGSHGSEFDIGFVHGLTPAEELHEKLRIELGALVDGRPGVHLEIKPASIAVHVRQASAEVAQEILSAVIDGPQVTLDRAVRLAARYARPADPAWTPLREQIAAEVLDCGWNSELGCFTTAYGGTDLDAATLHIGLSGLLAPDDERFQATVTAIEAELRSGSTVYRYNRDDALPGGEGGFHLCASWLVEAYLGCGRRTEAAELFQQIVDAAGPTGLLPEEYDPITERSLGNHPQAYSHLGLIRCAMLLDAIS